MTTISKYNTGIDGKQTEAIKKLAYKLSANFGMKEFMVKNYDSFVASRAKAIVAKNQQQFDELTKDWSEEHRIEGLGVLLSSLRMRIKNFDYQPQVKNLAAAKELFGPSAAGSRTLLGLNNADSK